MARNPELHKRRNDAVKEAYQDIKKSEPKWRYREWINHVANEFFLDDETVRKIVTGAYEKTKGPDPRQRTIFQEIEERKSGD